MKPQLSHHFQRRKPSVIRTAQIEFGKRQDDVEAINVAIGNVSLPMHPAMIRRLANLQDQGSPFQNGAVRYTPTVGVEETREAFRHIIASSGFSTEGLQVQITDGGSQAMELVILGVCGDVGTGKKPLLIIDPTYTNYTAMAARLGRAVVSLQRTLQEDGRFTLPEHSRIEAIIRERKPGALLVIPYDNPTGQSYSRAQMLELAELCVRYNLWMVSDEAYRELLYTGAETVSIWGIGDREVAGIEGRRISVESSSKVWNACGLRIGALVTDNEEFHTRAVAENTANLCPNAIGQYIFAALAGESHEELRRWYDQQQRYYKSMLTEFVSRMEQLQPGIIVSSPEASIYSVVDVRRIVSKEFDAMDFVLYCAREGTVDINGKRRTLLVAPMSGFYDLPPEGNPGRTQMRIAYVEPPERMALVPVLFKELLQVFLKQLNHRKPASSGARR
ncbi:MAG: aminotransferase class I/II-fold pyridoxal phosphate-dependent enzyme [Spirochaetaceae bacterium]|nr:MAG: aminotransferase class I/II-fold pyridoxal phosphate-dependent enzyme [Spirochaetaceae bacterium]